MSFAKQIRPFVQAELQAAMVCEQQQQLDAAFNHLERAHVLGQMSTIEHVRVHWRMLRFAWRRRDFRELRGQVLRVFGAATKTFIAWVPSGNTGGAKISPFQSLPIPPDLARIIDSAKHSNLLSR